jgi:molybdopterin converting factor small subunit
MQITIMVFGPLQDITGWNEKALDDIQDSESLVQALESIFPQFKGLEYQIAVNHDLIDQNTQFQDRDEVALLPPFSGG